MVTCEVDMAGSEDTQVGGSSDEKRRKENIICMLESIMFNNCTYTCTSVYMNG